MKYAVLSHCLSTRSGDSFPGIRNKNLKLPHFKGVSMRRNFSSLYGKTLSEKAQILEFSDYLAIDRTVMANERTLLAYIRTGVGLLIAGLALIRFFKQTHFDYYEIAGIASIIAAISVTIFGIRDFFHMRGFYSAVLEQQFLEQKTKKAEALQNQKNSTARS